ncbi:MAG TPA: isochorismatase family cysteine hydrolase [Hanamia sp.]|nr:isochorismatase family cysteine hydrolase [Hanamia sp.]
MEQNKQNTALLVMDMQTGILRNLPDTTQLVNNVTKAIAAARSNKIPVIYVTVGFRPGAPEINMNNKGFAAGKERFAHVNMDEFMKVEGAIAPLAGDIIVAKRRVSAFTGSDLEIILRSLNIQHIVLTGIATSGVVLSTVREAADKDYRITIISDCCADADEEVHRVLTTKVFLRQADVISTEEWCKE